MISILFGSTFGSVRDLVGLGWDRREIWSEWAGDFVAFVEVLVGMDIVWVGDLVGLDLVGLVIDRLSVL